MNEYLFYTTEGHTDAPNLNVPIENCQILGHVKANDIESAYKILFEENPWITKAKFNPCHIIGEQILTKSQKQNLLNSIKNIESSDKSINNSEEINTLLIQLKSIINFT